MKKILHFLGTLSLVSFAGQTLHAAIPLLEFTSKPLPNQLVKPQNTDIIYYTVKNNTPVTFPLQYTLSNPLASFASGNTCGASLVGYGSCVLAIQFHAPAHDGTESLTVQINYQGRGPLTDVVTFTTDSKIACELINTPDYQTPFCQHQYQQVLQYSPNVFNVTGLDVQSEQTLGGVFGLYQRLNNTETICYVSCGLRALNEPAPNEMTLFELASVTKTLTTSIFGKLLSDGTIANATAAAIGYLNGLNYSFQPNESQVTLQQLATFSGGVCFSDAPKVVQSNTDQVVNQANFVDNINSLNPDPTTTCLGIPDSPNVKSVYSSTPGDPPFLPSHNHYSNSSVGLLGQALMNTLNFGVLEAGFNDWMCTQLIDVLDMEHTNGCLPSTAIDQSCPASPTSCTHKTQWATSSYAKGYHLNGHSYQQGDPFPFLPWAPAGGIRSNAFDMIKFIRANLGFSTNNSPEQSHLIQGMQIAHNPNDYLPVPSSSKTEVNIGSQTPLLGPQGFAWVCMNALTNGDRICGKIGGHANFRSFVGINTTKNYGVVILFNTGAEKTNGSLRAVSPPSIGVIGTNLMSNVG